MAVATRNPREVISARAKVLGDRSIMIKYINWNIVALATVSEPAVTSSTTQTQKPFSNVNIYVFDTLSGIPFFTLTSYCTRCNTSSSCAKACHSTCTFSFSRKFTFLLLCWCLESVQNWQHRAIRTASRLESVRSLHYFFH